MIRARDRAKVAAPHVVRRLVIRAAFVATVLAGTTSTAPSFAQTAPAEAPALVPPKLVSEPIVDYPEG